MAVEVKTLKPTSNEVTLDRIRNRMSTDYQARIPSATKAGVQATMKSLMEYRPLRNQFIDALVNRIGLVVARNNSWSNPLAEFKSGMLSFGDTIEEYHMGLIKAKTYDADRDSLEKDIFGTNRPEVQSSFHTINRMDKYKITLDNPLLNRAFLETNGLTSFISKTMESVTTSDNWDEFLLTCALFPEYEANAGFHKVQIPDVSHPESGEADAKKALRVMRAVADKLTFISTKYNAAGMPMAAARSDLLLFVTPEFNAAIDVEALAGAFNITSAQLHGRIIPIPEENLGIDGLQAILTTRDFFVIADSVFETTQIFNPDSLQNNHWLHHHQVISASRFVPAILFTSKPGDILEIQENPVTSVASISVTDRDGVDVSNVTRGEIYQFTADVVTALENGTNEEVRWDVAGANSLLTYITQNGVLHVAGNEGATTLTVTATATYLDADNLMQDGKKATETVTVVGPSTAIWPKITGVTSITLDDHTLAPAFAAGTFAYTTTSEETALALKSKVNVTGPDSGDVKITSSGNVITIAAPSAPNDPVYTITVTDPTP